MIVISLSLLTAGAVYMAARAWHFSADFGAKIRLHEAFSALDVRLRKNGNTAQGQVGRLVGGGALLGALLVYGLGDSFYGAALGAAVGAFLPWGYVQIVERQQIAKFSGQVAGVLDLLSGSLRSGQSLSQALQSAAAEAAQPAAGYFAVVSQKMALGDAPELALDELAAQMKGQACEEELRMLATSVSVTRASGGNLAEILGQLADTVRERARMRAEIDSLTAQGKMSGWIVGSLPVFILVALNLLDPSLVAPMFHSSLGLGLLGIGVVLELLGAFLIQRIVSVDL